MLNQKKVEIFLAKTRKSPAKQFLEIAFIICFRVNVSKVSRWNERVNISSSRNFIIVVMLFEQLREENSTTSGEKNKGQFLKIALQVIYGILIERFRQHCD